ncbi:MAG: InlB B-repeat-containing protein, partial [Bacteroidales bacterium]|nr:InlB B-repeat-containing protein [Bacteroidales bacterium]
FIETPGLKLIGAVDSSGDPVTTIKAADVFTVISNMGSRRFLLSIEADDVLIENIIFDGRGVAVTPDPPSLALTGNLHLRGINAYCAVRVVIDNCVVKNVLAGLILNGINCLTSVSVSNFTATENMGWGYGIGVNDASLLVGENVDAIIIHNGNFPTINFNYYEIAASGTPVALRDLDIDEVFGINFYLTGNSGLASAFAFITVDVAGPSGANVTHELHIGGGNWVSVLNQPNGIGSGQLGSAAPGGLVSGGWLRFSADQGGDYQITYTLWDLGPGNNAWPSPSAVALAMASTTITVVAHVVTFVSDCETNIPEQIVGLSGIATEPTAPTRIGFTFEGWYTDSIAGSLWDFDIDLVTSDTTLFARWDTITYTVVFNALGGTPVPPNQTINHGDLATEPAALTRTGFTFDGWYTDSIAGSPWDFSTDVVISDTVLFARWVQQYTIITAANNSTLGTTAGDGTGFLEGQVIPLTATPNTGFVFMNWTIGGVVVSTDPSFAYTITDESAIETTVIANFGLLFEDFVSVRWGSTFTLNMVALGGLNITVNSCQWLSNDVLIHTGLNYSAGNTMNALLPNGEYRFVLQTGSGVIPSTVFQGVAPQTASLMGYPNPVISGQTFTVDGVTMGTRIEIFNQMGVLVISTVANSDQATIDIDLPVGIYFLRTEENGTMTIIVNN